MTAPPNSTQPNTTNSTPSDNVGKVSLDPKHKTTPPLPPESLKQSPQQTKISTPETKVESTAKKTERAPASTSPETKKPLPKGVDRPIPDEDAALPPGHYEIRTMLQDLDRLRGGGPTEPTSIKTEFIKHIPKEDEGPPGTPPAHHHEKDEENKGPIITVDHAGKMKISKVPIFGGQIIIILVGIAIILVAIAAVWFFILRPQGTEELPETQQQPTQTETTPLTPRETSILNAQYPKDAPIHIATNTEVVTAVTSASISTAISSLLEQKLPLNSITHIELRGTTSAGDLLTLTNISLPNAVLDNLRSVNPVSPMLVAVTPDNGETRLGLVVPISELTDLPSLRANLRAWEWRMDEDTEILFTGLSKGSPQTVTFLDNSYNNTPLRYRNFTNPDVTIDYAIIERAVPSLLFITTSRESLFYLIDSF